MNSTSLTTTTRRRARVLLAAASVTPVVLLATPAAADGPSPASPGTTVWSGDGTATSDSGEHDGRWNDDWTELYSDGVTGLPGDQSFDFERAWFYPSGVSMDAAVATFDRDPFVLSFRMRTTQIGMYSLAGARDVCTNSGNGWFDVRGGLNADGTGVHAEVGGDHFAAVTSPVAVNDGAWHTVDVRRDDTGIRLTVDGTTSTVATPPSSVRPTAPFGLNASPCIWQDQTWPFFGQLDDVRLGRLDVTPPAVTVPAAISVDATSPSGATVDYTAVATDAVDGPVAVTCSADPGSTFSVGTTTVTCTARDAAGNSGTASFPVTVRGATEQVRALADLVGSLGIDSLTVKAQQALSSLDRGNTQAARGQLGAMANSTQAAVQSRRLPAADGRSVTGAVARVLATLG